MPYAYPPHLDDFDYIGMYVYHLTFCTLDRAPVFTSADKVALVVRQILRAAQEEHFEITAHCAMPDHLHLIVAGEHVASNCKAFIKAAKQYSGYYYAQKYGQKLWQRYGYEHVVRDEIERFLTIGYVLSNPVKEGLAARPEDYPFIGSSRYRIEELLQQAPEPSA
jgi:REP element-mobilizing transposase RayT